MFLHPQSTWQVFLEDYHPFRIESAQWQNTVIKGIIIIIIVIITFSSL